MVMVTALMQQGDEIEKTKDFNTWMVATSRCYGGVDLRTIKQSYHYVHFEKLRLGKKFDDRFPASGATSSWQLLVVL